MKKILIVLYLLAVLVPSISLAAFDISLKFGSKGDAVYELQDFLQDQSFYPGKVDGKFGFGTLRGVRFFQAANDLSVDGYFGRLSRTKANEILATILKDSDDAEEAETGTISSAYVTPYTTPYTTPYATPYVTPVNNYATPYATPYAYPTPAPVVEPLAFTKAPKFLFVEIKPAPSYFSPIAYSLPKILFETNRPAKIVFGPATNKDGVWIDGSHGSDVSYNYTAETMTQESCGRQGVSPAYLPAGSYGGSVKDIVCTIRAQADDGSIVEAKVSVQNDSIVIPYIGYPVNY